MLSIEVAVGEESYDELTSTFIRPEIFRLDLEHSLVSLSKWESEFEKPFLSKEPKTDAEMFAYIKAMTLTPNTPDEVYDRLTQTNVDAIQEYIAAAKTATWFRESGVKEKDSRTLTSELIYYMMFSLQIDISCENWHLNRLTTLIRVFNEENSRGKKKTPAEAARAAAERHAINERRLREAEEAAKRRGADG